MKTESKIYRLLMEIVEEHDPTSAREEISRFKKMPTLKEAIKTAAESKKKDGTCYSHQRRVFSRPRAIPSATKILLAAEAKIEACTSFERLQALIVTLLADVFGIGPLYCYDVAIRIGASSHRFPFFFGFILCSQELLGLRLAWACGLNQASPSLPFGLRQLQFACLS